MVRTAQRDRQIRSDEDANILRVIFSLFSPARSAGGSRVAGQIPGRVLPI